MHDGSSRVLVLRLVGPVGSFVIADVPGLREFLVLVDGTHVDIAVGTGLPSEAGTRTKPLLRGRGDVVPVGRERGGVLVAQLPGPTMRRAVDFDDDLAA